EEALVLGVAPRLRFDRAREDEPRALELGLGALAPLPAADGPGDEARDGLEELLVLALEAARLAAVLEVDDAERPLDAGEEDRRGEDAPRLLEDDARALLEAVVLDRVVDEDHVRRGERLLEDAVREDRLAGAPRA